MFRQNGVISSSGEVVSGFRGAALNQSRSASGVYTGLLWWHQCGYQRKCYIWQGGHAAAERKADNGSAGGMTPPRSLGR